MPWAGCALSEEGRALQSSGALRAAWGVGWCAWNRAGFPAAGAWQGLAVRITQQW